MTPPTNLHYYYIKLTNLKLETLVSLIVFVIIGVLKTKLKKFTL